MLGRIVEIENDQRHLSVFRGFMVIENTEVPRNTPGRELGRIALNDIAALIVHAHGISYTNNLLVSLAQKGTPFVLCAANHNAIGMLLPVEGNFQQAKRFDAQIQATQPTHKRLWATIVKAKLEQQAAVLQATGSCATVLTALAKQVRTGDTDNKEAQGAQRYWPLLFGPQFRRDQSAQGINALLNYGYTILRAAMARSIIAAGLHPTLGIHHLHENNAMRLVDDLMEPFRPLMDYKVWQIHTNWQQNNSLHPIQLTPDIKRALALTLYADMQTNIGATPVSACMQRLATSLAQVYLKERDTLDLPYTELPMDLLTL